MDNFVCKECGLDLKSEIGLHKHFRAHKMTQAAYYQKHYPRYDKYDKTIIRFKSRDYYFSCNFNSRSNLRLWLNSVSKDEALAYISETLKLRKDRKGLVFAPSQVELRSLPLPGMSYIQKLVNYYDFCAKLGFTNKYGFYALTNPLLLNKSHKIYIDTREKDLLKFKRVSTEIKKLDYGDYSFSDPKWTGKTHIERKSLTDFIGTLSFGLERFRKELTRAKDDNAYVIVLVEDSLSNCLVFNSLPYLPSQIKISSEYVFHNVREVIQEFENVQFLFVENHQKAADMVEKLFSVGSIVQKVDLQFLKDINII